MKHGDFQKPVSYFDILQVSEKAGDMEIRRAYHKLAKRFHPDQNSDERKLSELRFKLINEAYANLKTKEKRARYRRLTNKMQKPTWNKKPMNDNPAPHKQGIGFFEILARLFRASPRVGS